MPCTGYVIKYVECPLLWCSKLQTEIALSTTEAEYIELNLVMRKAICFLELTKEVTFIFDINLPNPEVFCKLFKENQICIAVAKSKNITKNKTYFY